MPFDCFATDIYESKPPGIDPCKEESEVARLKAKYGRKVTVEWDEENKLVMVGEMHLKGYYQYKKLDTFMSAMFNAHGIFNVSGHPKWKARTFSEVFGYPARHLHDHMNKLLYKKFVVPYKDILVKVNFQRGRVAVNSLRDIQRNEAVCREVYEDGLYNLLPLVALVGKSPKELKKEWGGAWKALSNNSLNKNRELVKHLPRCVGGAIKSDELRILATLPTSVLKLGGNTYVMQHLAQHYKGKWSKLKDSSPKIFGRGQTKELRDIEHTISDTKFLASQLDAPFDPLWSPRKMKEKHDQYSRELNARKFSPAKIEWLDEVAVKEASRGKYKATLLDSRALIAEEGSVMGHCVAGYAESVAGGSYLVYSITKGGERSSTLGINVWNRGVGLEGNLSRQYVLSQHYGKYNARLTDDAEIMLGKGIVAALNGENVIEHKSQNLL